MQYTDVATAPKLMSYDSHMTTASWCIYLLEYSKDETMFINVFGLMSLFSRNWYRFTWNRSLLDLQ